MRVSYPGMQQMAVCKLQAVSSLLPTNARLDAGTIMNARLGSIQMAVGLAGGIIVFTKVAVSGTLQLQEK